MTIRVAVADDEALLRTEVGLMDIRMPGMDGIETTRQIVPSGSVAREPILTTFDEDEYVPAALRVGAGGLLLKAMESIELVAAIRAHGAARTDRPVRTRDQGAHPDRAGAVQRGDPAGSVSSRRPGDGSVRPAHHHDRRTGMKGRQPIRHPDTRPEQKGEHR